MSLTALETRLCDHIAGLRDALIDDLRTHVALATGGRNMEAIERTRELLVTRALKLGASHELIAGDRKPEWLYAEIKGQEPLRASACRRAGLGRELLLAGHMDTVHDPAGAFRELHLSADGKTATGPGVVDMKGGLVILLAALESLDGVGARPAWTLLLNADEETGSYHSAQAIMREAARVHASRGVGVAVEPANGKDGLVVERAGSGQFMLEVRGVAAHVGRDFAKGVSAVGLLARAINQALALADANRGLLVNIGPLQGGIATNIVPDLARAWGNVRFADSADAERFEHALQDMAVELSRGSQARIEVHINFARPAKPKTQATMQLAVLAQAAAADLGQAMSFVSTGGVCDGNLMQAVGLPTIDTLGVRGGGLHTTSEWIELDSLVERCQLLALTILRASQASD